MALSIRPLTAQDLSEAGRIIRLAFGTFLGAPEPEQFWADMDYAHTRWRADPTAAFGHVGLFTFAHSPKHVGL